MEVKGGSSANVRTGSKGSAYGAGFSVYTKGAGKLAERIPACGYGIDLIVSCDEKGLQGRI